MTATVQQVQNAEVIVNAVHAIQTAMHCNVLAIVLVDYDGQVSSIPNPNLRPWDVFRALGGQNWETSARIAEEMCP